MPTNLPSPDAWHILQTDPTAQLVDVRTVAEWGFVGCPDMSALGKRLVRLSWRLYPQMNVNPAFMAQLAAEIPDKETPLLFLCRSGGRSLDAAMAAADSGYLHCYNIQDGFEGEPDSKGHRGVVSGWKAAQLPWVQT